MRLDKYLATMAVGSRSQVKVMIKKGHVTVNGQTIKQPEVHIDEVADVITVDGKPLTYQQFSYYMLNKPAGVLSAVTDAHGTTVLDLLNRMPKNGLFPVGRLDKDTEGLLLITNDGALAHDLLSPAKHVDKTYYVELDGALVDADIAHFAAGVDIGEKALTKPARLQILAGKTSAYITITEGKYHQVKRMFGAIGLTVMYLKRLSMGPLTLDEHLTPGAYRPLTTEEVALLKAAQAKL